MNVIQIVLNLTFTIAFSKKKNFTIAENIGTFPGLCLTLAILFYFMSIFIKTLSFITYLNRKLIFILRALFTLS